MPDPALPRRTIEEDEALATIEWLLRPRILPDVVILCGDHNYEYWDFAGGPRDFPFKPKSDA